MQLAKSTFHGTKVFTNLQHTLTAWPMFQIPWHNNFGQDNSTFENTYIYEDFTGKGNPWFDVFSLLIEILAKLTNGDSSLKVHQK